MRLPDAYAGGSSIMPQKKNPDAAELMRAAAPRLTADLGGLLGVLHGLPLAYNTDLREDKRYLFDAVDCLDQLLPVVRGLLEEVTFDEARMAAACDPFLAATDVADYLVEKGLPFREAHHLTGGLVRRCLESGEDLAASRSRTCARSRRRSTRATTPCTNPPRSWRASARAAGPRPRACASSSSVRAPLSRRTPAADDRPGCAVRQPGTGSPSGASTRECTSRARAFVRKTCSRTHPESTLRRRRRARPTAAAPSRRRSRSGTLAPGAAPALPQSFFARSALEVARDLIGCTLLFDGAGGRIVETEAYRQDDPCCHGYRGRTERNAVLFGPPGHLYVYFTYGMHFCANVASEEEGVAAGVLLRALEPEVGVEDMAPAAGLIEPRLLASGPARLAQALGIGRAQNGLPVWEPPLAILPRDPAAPAPTSSPRRASASAAATRSRGASSTPTAAFSRVRSRGRPFSRLGKIGAIRGHHAVRRLPARHAPVAPARARA